jgi:hypothetical protein
MTFTINDVDEVTKLVVPDLRYPPPGVVVFVGYLGQALKRPPKGSSNILGDTDLEPAATATETYWRLYLNDQFNKYIEFRDDDVVAYRKLKVPAASVGVTSNYTILWLTEDAHIDYVHTQSLQLHRGFLQGDIADSAGASSGQGLAGGAALGGGTIPPFCPGATVLPPCTT